MIDTIVFSACSASKKGILRGTIRASKLYTGQAHNKIKEVLLDFPKVTWRIISAEHGIISPLRQLAWYERKMPKDAAAAGIEKGAHREFARLVKRHWNVIMTVSPAYMRFCGLPDVEIIYGGMMTAIGGNDVRDIAWDVGDRNGGRVEWLAAGRDAARDAKTSMVWLKARLLRRKLEELEDKQ
jgi:hypothetical protein